MDMQSQDDPVMQPAEDTKEQEFKAFEAFHSPQLVAMGFPKELTRRLFNKLKFSDYDLGEHVQMILDEEDEKMYVRTLKPMSANGDVFLIDHAWTFKQRDAYPMIFKNEPLRDRLENLVKYSGKRDLPGENPYKKPEAPRPTLAEYLKKCEESTEPVLSYDLDEYEIKSLKDFKFRPEVEEISLFDNEVIDPNDVTKVLMTLPNLRALWLNNNPVATQCSNFEIIGNHFEKLEIINSKLTSKAGEWAMLFYARDSGAKTLEEITELDLSGKNLLMVDDISFLSKMTNLKKLNISDNVDMYKPAAMLAQEAQKAAEGSGQAFDFMENKHNRDDLLRLLPNVEHLECDIILEAYILEMRPKSKDGWMLPKLKTINKIPMEVTELGERTKHKKTLEIYEKIWRYCGNYRLVKPGVMDEEPIFYINDEVGSSITHSDDPNCCLSPFIYMPNCEGDDYSQAKTFSIFWVCKDVKKEQFLERDFLKGVTEKEWRSARLFPWYDVYPEYFEAELKKHRDYKPPFDAKEKHQELQAKYAEQPMIDWEVATDGPVPVYTDYDQVKKYLKDTRFTLVDDPTKAKILWLTFDYAAGHWQQWDIDYSKVYVNQYKKEAALVSKQHLANMVNATLTDRSCIMETYDLQTKLPCFIGDFLEREAKGDDNTWIIKPTSMARSIDTWVVRNAEQVCRLMETGPKVAQKYIHRPLTYQGRKFTLRYNVHLQSLLPLRLYAYEEFFVQFANNQFTMAETTFHEYETHFTVMNYGQDMLNMRCHDFVKNFDEEYKGRTTYAEISKKIYEVITDVFVAFQTQYGEELHTLGDLDKSRGLYGVDIMVDQDLNAKLLEVTFAPDMKRAGLFRPKCWDELFANLFFHEETNMTRLV